MKETLNLTVKLLIICVVISLLLAVVNRVTEPIIETNNQKSFQSSMGQVLPEAASFTEIDAEKLKDFTPTESGVKVESVYAADGGGYVVSTVCSEGYGGDIEIMAGIDSELKIKQVKIMSLSETPGLGAKAQNTDFITQYNGLGGKISVVKNQTSSGDEIQAISGATITSKAVTKAVNAALEAAEYAKGGDAK